VGLRSTEWVPSQGSRWPGLAENQSTQSTQQKDDSQGGPLSPYVRYGVQQNKQDMVDIKTALLSLSEQLAEIKGDKQNAMVASPDSSIVVSPRYQTPQQRFLAESNAIEASTFRSAYSKSARSMRSLRSSYTGLEEAEVDSETDMNERLELWIYRHKNLHDSLKRRTAVPVWTKVWKIALPLAALAVAGLVLYNLSLPDNLSLFARELSGPIAQVEALALVGVVTVIGILLWRRGRGQKST
jgi:hypothetical protein